MVFYRYIRPKRFVAQRCELITHPRGGVCLRFEELSEGDLFFTYARCHPSDYFSRSVAKDIADARATHARATGLITHLRGLPHTQNTDLLIHSVVRKCQALNPEDTFLHQCFCAEHRQLATVLHDLHSSNTREHTTCEAWKRVNVDLWKTAYEEMNR